MAALLSDASHLTNDDARVLGENLITEVDGEAFSSYERSTTESYQLDSLDSVDDFMHATARQRRGPDSMDDPHHLAKVRVAGSNPVVRSPSSALGRLLTCGYPSRAVLVSITF